MRQVALLRGVNLGACNRLRMADLREAVEGLGYEDVATVLQSGNAIFTSSDPAATAARRIRRALKTHVDVDVLVRTRADIARLVRANPLGDVATEPKRHLVLFLDGRPPDAAIRHVDPAAYEPERFARAGRELVIWLPGGVHRAKLVPSFWEKRLDLRGTARNWATVEKLLAAMS